MLRRTLWTIFSAALAASCSQFVPRPNANVCVVNAGAGRLECFNLQRDYDDNGVLKPVLLGGTQLPITSVNDLNKYVCVNPTDLVELKTYIGAIRAEVKSCEGR